MSEGIAFPGGLGKASGSINILKKDMGIGIWSPRNTRWDTSRVPDVVVLPAAQWEAMRSREVIIESDLSRTQV